MVARGVRIASEFRGVRGVRIAKGDRIISGVSIVRRVYRIASGV